MARPRKQDARDLRGLAIEAAIALLSDRETPDLSMAEVARAIECSAPALYAYFTDRDDLLDTVRRTVIDRQTAGKTARYRRPSRSALEALADGGHAYLEDAAKAPALYRLVHCRTVGSGGAADAISGPALSALAQGVNACRAEGYATDHPPDHLARLLWSMVHGAAMLALDSPADQRAEAWVRAHQSVDLAIALIRGAGRQTDGARDDSPSIAHGDGP